LRCFDWVDLRPIPVGDAGTPRRLGEMLACLHRRAPTAEAEPYDGGPPDPWYDRAPAPDDWVTLSRSGAVWAAKLCQQVEAMQSMCSEIKPVDPASLILCHRDLHPQNVFADQAGRFVLVDCEDLGPAEPGRELARAVFDWCCDSRHADLGAARSMIQGYLSAGGPGRVNELGDFSMLLASRLNFVLEQARLALNQDVAPRHREWARQEVDSMRRLMPTSRQLHDVLAVARDCNHNVRPGPEWA
ncbi:MAG TPA: aminoglycoside phosphotransferase family protein, partial [Mycobacterium sp.]|nr:aminoglycoside phosphotransferase family protein [Mycobacterium sp.]